MVAEEEEEDCVPLCWPASAVAAAWRSAVTTVAVVAADSPSFPEDTIRIIPISPM